MKGYYNFSYNSEVLKNVPTIIKEADDKLKEARGILSSIKIPGDFFYSDFIKQSPSKIDNIKGQLNEAGTEIYNLLVSLYETQARNDNIVSGLAYNLIHGKRIDVLFEPKIVNRKTMAEDLRKKVGSIEIKAYTINGKTQYLTYAEYIMAMGQKAAVYDSETNFTIMVDAENAQVTVFERKNKKSPWQCIALWNSVQGVKEPGHLPGNEEKVEKHKGPHSRSFTGAYEVHGRSDPNQGLKTCYCEHEHSSNLEIDNCQGFEPSSWGNPDYMDEEDRFESHGCTNLSDEKAEWIYYNIPDNTKVVVFNEANEWPDLDD